MEEGQNLREPIQSILVFVLFRLSFVFVWVCFVERTHFHYINHWFILPILFAQTHIFVPFTFLSRSLEHKYPHKNWKCSLYLIYSSSHNNRQDLGEKKLLANEIEMNGAKSTECQKSFRFVRWEEPWYFDRILCCRKIY